MAVRSSRYEGQVGRARAPAALLAFSFSGVTHRASYDPVTPHPSRAVVNYPAPLHVFRSNPLGSADQGVASPPPPPPVFPSTLRPACPIPSQLFGGPFAPGPTFSSGRSAHGGYPSTWVGPPLPPVTIYAAAQLTKRALVAGYLPFAPLPGITFGSVYDMRLGAPPPPPFAFPSVKRPGTPIPSIWVPMPPSPAVTYRGVYAPKVARAASHVAVQPGFFVIFWTPAASNVARVFLNVEPTHQSVLGATDVLNRLNWNVSLVSGPGTSPVIEQVENAQAQPTAVDGYPLAWSVDLRLDRPITQATSYLVVASNLVAFNGAALAAPPFDRGVSAGDMLVRPRWQPPVVKGAIDYRYETFEGRYSVDSRGDIDVHTGVEYLKKRVFRRLLSHPGGFFHLPDYGVGLRPKVLMSTTDIARTQKAIEKQVLAEEDVAAVSVAVSLLASSALLVVIKVKARTGGGFDATLEVPTIGPIVVS